MKITDIVARTITQSSPRKGLKDIWNAFMANGAKFCEHDIPFCPTTATQLPTDIITWEEAEQIYKEQQKKKLRNFKHNTFVCFYQDDYKFDGPKGIWFRYKRALKILSHFEGVISPDFSTYQDFPKPLKLHATYKMRLMGYWFGKNGIQVINNVRWGTEETYDYCFVGIPCNSIVAIGTVGGSPKQLIDRVRFEEGLKEMVRRLSPHTIIVYGSANYECFHKLKEQGINVLSFQSKTAKVFARRNSYEQK